MSIKLINENLVGKVQTVLGIINPEEMGITITHEHLLVDETNLFQEPEDPDLKETFYAPLDMEILNRLYFAGHTNLESATMLDENLAIEEASHFRHHGGKTIVDATSIGLGRNPKGLQRIAQATGLNVIMGSSYYIDSSLAQEVREMSGREITDKIVKEFFAGVEDTHIRPGLIGEVGCSWPITSLEKRILRASSRAQQFTGAPLMIHPGRNPDAPMHIVKILEKEGSDLKRVIMCHIDRTIFDHAKLTKLASTGVVLEYDLFGHEHSHYRFNLDIDQPNDAERLRYIRYLIDEGYGNQVLVSHDCDNKIYLRKYGGGGYAHIVENVVPKALMRGYTQEEIDQILIHTPQRLFTFTAL